MGIGVVNDYVLLGEIRQYENLSHAYQNIIVKLFEGIEGFPVTLHENIFSHSNLIAVSTRFGDKKLFLAEKLNNEDEKKYRIIKGSKKNILGKSKAKEKDYFENCIIIAKGLKKDYKSKIKKGEIEKKEGKEIINRININIKLIKLLKKKAKRDLLRSAIKHKIEVVERQLISLGLTEQAQIYTQHPFFSDNVLGELKLNTSTKLNKNNRRIVKWAKERKKEINLQIKTLSKSSDPQKVEKIKALKKIKRNLSSLKSISKALLETYDDEVSGIKGDYKSIIKNLFYGSLSLTGVLAAMAAITVVILSLVASVSFPPALLFVLVGVAVGTGLTLCAATGVEMAYNYFHYRRNPSQDQVRTVGAGTLIVISAMFLQGLGAQVLTGLLFVGVTALRGLRLTKDMVHDVLAAMHIIKSREDYPLDDILQEIEGQLKPYFQLDDSIWKDLQDRAVQGLELETTHHESQGSHSIEEPDVSLQSISSLSPIMRRTSPIFATNDTLDESIDNQQREAISMGF